MLKSFPLARIHCFAAIAGTLTLLAPFVASAEPPLKIGHVDMRKAIRSGPDGKAAKSKLEKEAKKKQGALDKRQNELKKMKDELEKQASLLKEEVKREKFKVYQQKLMELQEAYVQNQNELKTQEEKLLRPILEKLKKTIATVAQKKGYTLVIEQGTLLYGLPSLDITTAVIAAYK